MPRVVKTGGGRVTDDVVRIRDLAANVAPKAPAKTPEEEQREIAADFMPDFAEGAGEEKTNETVPEEALPPADGDAVEDAYFEEAKPEPEPDLGMAPTADLDARAAVEPVPAAPQAAAPMPDISSEIIQSAMAEAGRILEDAVKSAEDRKAELLAGIEDEAARLKQAAVEEGRRQGMSAVGEEIERLSGQMVGAISRFEGGRAAYEAEYEEQLKWMSLEIASKVLAKKVSEDDAVLAEMVDKAVQSVRGEPWIRVDVAQEMTRLIDSLQQLYETQANIEVGGVPAAPGSIQIETPSGAVDASLATQLQNLREYFARGTGPAAESEARNAQT